MHIKLFVFWPIVLSVVCMFIALLQSPQPKWFYTVQTSLIVLVVGVVLPVAYLLGNVLTLSHATPTSLTKDKICIPTNTPR